MAVSECARDRFFRWIEEEGAKGEVWDTSAARTGAFVSDAVDGVDDEGIGGPEFGGERGCLELTEAVSAGKVSAELDVVRERCLLHEEEECADGGIGKTHWMGGRGQEEKD